MTEKPGSSGQSEPVGSLAEEAARLLAALAGAARDHGADDPGGRDDDAHLGDPGGRDDDADLGDPGGRAASGASDQSRPTDLGDRFAAAVHEIDEHLATGGEECRYCPVCRAVSLVRRTSPEAVEHLAESARSLSRALAAMLATANVEDRRAEGRAGSGVEHIDLDDTVDVEADPDQHDPEQQEDA